jgi:tellurite methyltransferase
MSIILCYNFISKNKEEKMALQDKEKWNKKYQNTPSLTKDRKACRKLELAQDYANKQKALDVACGTGRNSIYLSSLGYEVDAIDISEVAIEILNEKKIKNINTKVVDLDEYIPPKENYDLIVMSNFLDRNMIEHLKNSLRKDGVLVIETYMHHEINTKKNSNPDFLLQEGELKTFFDKKFELIEYDEFDNDDFELYRMRKQSIIIKKK